jgi:NADH-quinone oxidoreductase subunit K
MNAAAIMVMASFLGAAALWSFLPRAAERTPGRRGAATGVVLGAVGLALFGSQLPAAGGWGVNLAFYPLAAVTLAAGVAVVAARGPGALVRWYGLLSIGTLGLSLVLGGWCMVLLIVILVAVVLVVLFWRASRSAGQGAGSGETCREPLIALTAGAVVVGVLMVTLDRALALPVGPDEAAAGGLGLLHNGLAVGAMLVGIGLVGVLSRRSRSAELFAAATMFLGVLLSVVAWTRWHGGSSSQTVFVALMVTGVLAGAYWWGSMRIRAERREQVGATCGGLGVSGAEAGSSSPASRRCDE